MRVKEKLRGLEVCVSLKVHHKVFKRFFDKIVVWNNSQKKLRLSIIAIIAIIPIIVTKTVTA